MQLDELHKRIDAELSETSKSLVEQISALNAKLEQLNAERQKRHDALDFALGNGVGVVFSTPPYASAAAVAASKKAEGNANGAEPAFPAARETRSFVERKVKHGEEFDQRNVFNYFVKRYPREVKARQEEILRSQISRALSNGAGTLWQLVAEGKGGKPNLYRKL